MVDVCECLVVLGFLIAVATDVVVGVGFVGAVGIAAQVVLHLLDAALFSQSGFFGSVEGEFFHFFHV